jgi:hypothetical protein
VRSLSFLLAGLACVILAACTSASSQDSPAHAAKAPTRWAEFRHLPGVVDVAGPRGDGSFVVSAAGRLFLFDGKTLTPFARGPGGYQTNTGGEPYLTVASNVTDPSRHCSFGMDEIFALEPGARPEVIVISGTGQARPFAGLPPGESLGGIAFDGTGRFGHRLLVTSGHGGRTTVYAIDCTGTPSAIATNGPPVEGGIAVAPLTFGGFGGDLIAPNETSGLVYAFRPDGSTVTLAVSHLPSGGDIGVESAGFVPPGFTARQNAYLADRYSGPQNKHPGDNSLLQLSGTQLTHAGVQPGDLLVAAEGGALTIDIRCATTCTTRYLADGPPIGHGEGHVAVIP